MARNLGRPTGSGATLLTLPFAYGDASPLPLYLCSTRITVLSSVISIRTPFNGTDAVLRLVCSSGKNLLDADEVLPSLEGMYGADHDLTLEAGTTLQLNIGPGLGATQGSGLVLLEFV